MNTNKSFYVLMITILVVLALGAPTNVFAQGEPSFSVRLTENEVHGYEWPLGAQVTLSIDGVPYGPETVVEADWDPNQTFVRFDLGEAITLQGGQYIEMTDGTTTKTHTVTSLVVDGVDPVADTVYGRAGAGSQVDVGHVYCDENGCYGFRREIADGSGNWVADFSVPGEDPDEQEIIDLQPGMGSEARQCDEDGECTTYGWSIPNPTIQAQLGNNRVGGWEWPPGETVTVEIDDPATGSNPDYSANATVGVAEWDPEQTWFEINFQGLYDLKSGDLVTVSHGTTSKTLTVAPLEITEVDHDLDTVSGITNPGAELNVWIHEESFPEISLTADETTGEWTADFSGLWDILPRTDGAAAQYDEDGDETWVGWEITKPRMEVSYEHDWVQIYGFTPGGDVTYTIYDEEGGHALFGPVTGPVDSHGEGWISQQLTRTDLIPGYFITAVDETTGEEVSLLIRDLNFDYLGVDDDLAFGTAEPNTTIDFHVSETYQHGFNLSVDVDASGYWEVDLAAAGYPIDSYRHAGIELYDAEGDRVFAMAPRIVAQVGTDNIGIDFYTKNNDITLTLWDSPGGTLLYGPEVHRTDGAGNVWVNLWEQGIDLVPGNYIEAYDHHLDFTKSLEIEPFTFDGIDATNDTVHGTSIQGEWVELHVESLFSNWYMDVLTDENENWFGDYGAENYDITEQMWAYGWAIDDQNNWSEDHITGLTNIEASIIGDWISGYNFSPDRDVRIQIFDSEGGNLLREFLDYVQGDTYFQADHQEHGIDLQPGMYLMVEDLETGKTSDLLLENLTFDGVDYDNDVAWGQADAGAEVVVRANYFFESYEVDVIADSSGNWAADFSTLGANLTSDWDLRAQIYDFEYDATVADAPQLPEFTASLEMNWVNGNHWTPDSSVEINVYEFDGGSQIGSPVTCNTDNYGYFDVDLWREGFDLQPGYYITVYDNNSGLSKYLTLANLTIDYVDADNDVAGGIAPPDTRLSVDFNNDQEGIQFDLFSESDGTWEADFGAHDFDLQEDSEWNVRIYDDDDDATQVEVYVPNPTIYVRANEDRVEGQEWPEGASITVDVDDPATPQNPDQTGTATVGYAPWDPNQTYFELDFGEAIDIQPGFVVTATDGASTKDHVVTNLAFTDFDLEADVVSGIATPSGQIDIWACEDHNCFNNNGIPVDASGNWSADFTGIHDVQAGTWVDSVEREDDGDGTMYGIKIPNPFIRITVNTDLVYGIEWPEGQTVTIQIDDPSTQENPDYTDYVTVGSASWDPKQTYFELDVSAVINIQPGFIITATDGATTKSHVVTALTITDFDLDADIVYGVATPDSKVDLWLCNDDGCEFFEGFLTNASGNWSANFQGIYNLEVGTRVYASEIEEDDDGTEYDVNIPSENQPPDCSGATPSIDTLWPTNHKFLQIQIQGVTDPDGDAFLITIDNIFQDEPVDAPGSGNTSPDGQGVGSSVAEVRAERAGSGNGRVYHIYFTVDDGQGGMCTGEVLVGVPKSKGKKGAPIDDGALYDSTIAP